ncbi:copper resistance protein CopC [Agrococcus sp. SL85]|uniref:copper resistance CopC family protein n=1 Tax=Agrococcus sp. SL85 TaxID=2995141 RepID=UPI00226CBB07|nr:copper resistance CopC family protein [Agrococcus sp. SL85]WAC66113.1 copper resistance protein CopC [Agrococcus sp. SL85]
MQLAVAAALVAVLLPAHASVIGSTPAEGDALAAQPGTVSVTMNEEILDVPGGGSNALQVTDASGAFYGDGCASVEGDTVSMPVELGAPGEYELTYQVVSADGHPVSDTIAFTYEGEAGPAGLAEAPVCGEAAATEPAEATETEAAAEPAPPGATSDDAPAATDAADPAAQGADEGGAFPFIAVGVLAMLAVLALIAYTVNKGRRRER